MVHHELRREFISIDRDGRYCRQAEIMQEEGNREDLRNALQQTGSQSYLRRMRNAGVDLAALRLHARFMLDPSNLDPTSTNSSSLSSELLQNVSYPLHPRQPPLDAHVSSQRHERGQSPFYPYARKSPTEVQTSSQLPRIVPAFPQEDERERSLHHPYQPNPSARTRSPSQPPYVASESGPSRFYPYGLHPPARPRSPAQFPRIVDLRERDRVVIPIDTGHEQQLGIVENSPVSEHKRSQHRNSNGKRNMRQRSTSIVGNEPTQNYVSRGRKAAPINRGKESHTTSDHGINMNERLSHPPQRAGHNSAPTYVKIVPRQSSGSRSQRRSRSHESEDNQAEYQIPVQEGSSSSRRNMTSVDGSSTHRRPQSNNNIYPPSSGTQDLRRTEESKRTSRSRSVGPADEQQTGSRRASRSRSSCDSGIYVRTNSNHYIASDRPLPRAPNVNHATRPPISTAQRPSRRASSASSYDSGVFMSRNTTRSGSTDRNFTSESSTPRQLHVLNSFPPPVDENWMKGGRRSSGNR